MEKLSGFGFAFGVEEVMVMKTRGVDVRSAMSQCQVGQGRLAEGLTYLGLKRFIKYTHEIIVVSLSFSITILTT